MITKNVTTTTIYPNDYYNTDGTKQTKSIYANGQLVSTIETVGEVISPYYTHTDHLGSTNVTSNSAGNLVETLDYYPYGNQRISSGLHTEQRQYIGQMYDTDTQLNYLNARYYKADIGKFISQDSMFWQLPAQLLIDPQQQNSYSYARNNPINMKDPSGNATVWGMIKSYLVSFRNSMMGGSSTSSSTTSSVTSKSTATTTSGVSLMSYKGSNFTGNPVTANSNFINGLKEINQIAQNNKVMVNVTSSGVRNAFVPVNGVTVPQSDRSNHYVGSAIDVNIISGKTGKNCNNSCLRSNNVPSDVSEFTKDISESPNLRWGGEWKGEKYDPVHIDNGFNVNNFSEWKREYQLLQGASYHE